MQDPDLVNAVVSEWVNLHGHAPTSRGKPSLKIGGYYRNKCGLNLKWNVQKLLISVIDQVSINFWLNMVHLFLNLSSN